MFTPAGWSVDENRDGYPSPYPCPFISSPMHVHSCGHQVAIELLLPYQYIIQFFQLIILILLISINFFLMSKFAILHDQECLQV